MGGRGGSRLHYFDVFGVFVVQLREIEHQAGQKRLAGALRRGAQPAGETEKGILMYFSQPGESLWDIAKRYRVSCDSLKRMNPELEEGAATQPQRVILWRK